MGRVYNFIIGEQSRESESQTDLRREIMSLLNFCYFDFKLTSGKTKSNRFEIKKNVYSFESQDEARAFALKVLETGVVFFCELKEVKVE